MKVTKYIPLAALALLGTLASCDKGNEDFDANARPDNAVNVDFSVGNLKATRSNPAATDDTQREFNQGDQISVSTEGQDPVLFQCTDADMQTWAEAEAGKFLLWKQNEMTFQAYYPATTGTSMTAFTLPADQSSVDKIALADYMTRQQTCNN
ncbi:MAG: fimbrillin family protein, partial [Bacteroidales bacterium]|nr:fimbrillin family protein [Bacteroidales bacterium]